MELELIGYVRLAIAGLIDVDVVTNVIAELEEVRSPERRLERQVFEMTVTVPGSSGLTNAYVSVLSATGSLLIAGASR